MRKHLAWFTAATVADHILLIQILWSMPKFKVITTHTTVSFTVQSFDLKAIE